MEPSRQDILDAVARIESKLDTMIAALRDVLQQQADFMAQALRPKPPDKPN